MMKSKKMMIVFILVVAFLMLMVTFVKASDVGQLPTIVTDQNNTAQTPTGGNNQAGNSALDNNTLNISGNNTSKNNETVGNNTTLPQTGIEENTATIIFIAVCIVSAVYAYFKIRKYNEIH